MAVYQLKMTLLDEDVVHVQQLKAKCAIKVVCGAITGLSLKLACYDFNVDGGDSESADWVGSKGDQ